jgi:hypothetical protein
MKGDDLWNLVVDGDYEGYAATLILIDDHGVIVDKKPIHIGS